MVRAEGPVYALAIQEPNIFRYPTHIIDGIELLYVVSERAGAKEKLRRVIPKAHFEGKNNLEIFIMDIRTYLPALKGKWKIVPL